MTKSTILTGIRSNEEPTLGNYLGAFLPMVEMQRKYSGQYQINMFVPDLHSFTTPIDHDTLAQHRKTVRRQPISPIFSPLHGSVTERRMNFEKKKDDLKLIRQHG